MDIPRHRLVALRQKVQKEFQELPGLRLTRWQAARLLGLDATECEGAMRALVAAKLLRETRDGFVAGELCIARRPLEQAPKAASIPIEPERVR